MILMWLGLLFTGIRLIAFAVNTLRFALSKHKRTDWPRLFLRPLALCTGYLWWWCWVDFNVGVLFHNIWMENHEILVELLESLTTPLIYLIAVFSTRTRATNKRR